MNCLYCRQPAHQQGDGAKSSIIFYRCHDCNVFLQMDEEEVVYIYFYNLMINNKYYQVQMDLEKKITRLHFFPEDNKPMQKLFEVNCIPNWTPANVLKKISLLIIFS